MSEIDKALVFAILMENGRGTIDKAPSYMLEKWDAIKDMSHPERLLDSFNMGKYENWRRKWLAQPPDR